MYPCSDKPNMYEYYFRNYLLNNIVHRNCLCGTPHFKE